MVRDGTLQRDAFRGARLDALAITSTRGACMHGHPQRAPTASLRPGAARRFSSSRSAGAAGELAGHGPDGTVPQQLLRGVSSNGADDILVPR